MAPTAPVEFYRASFARQCARKASGEHRVVDQAGICGLVGTRQAPDGRLLVTDDEALPVLQALSPDLPVRFVTAFHTAPQCCEHLHGLPHWRRDDVTAMVCQNLTAVPAPGQMSDLTIRPVHRVAEDPADWVPLQDALQACMEADPSTAGLSLANSVTVFESLPGVTRLFAAVDGATTVRATAGASVFGPDATAFFVSTHHAWRGRGVAMAMTATALHWAQEVGAQAAMLDASAAGLSIYRRLGFHAVGSATVFAPPEGASRDPGP